MAPLDFKHMTTAKYRPGEDDATNYYAQKRKKQYHGNEGKEVKELSMKPDKKLPNLKVPAKGKKGISKFMRKKLITKTKDDVNAAVQSADRKPEKYMKPDGKVGIRMVKTDKEVVKKEASVLKPKSAMDIVKHARTLAKNPRDYMMNRKKYIDKARAKVFKMYPKEEVEEAMSLDQRMRMMHQASASQKQNQKKRDEKEKKSMAAKAAMDMKANNEATWPDEMPPTNEDKYTYFDTKDDAHAHAKKHGGKVYTNTGKGATKVKGKPVNTHVVIKNQTNEIAPAIGTLVRTAAIQTGKNVANKLTSKNKTNEDTNVDEALNIQQRMKRSRLMKRMKSRIAIGRKRASRKMANKKTLEKRSLRQARNELAKKLTRGIPKSELTFARKKEIEKRLEKPALQQRIKRLAKRKFKDVRKKEVQRKKG